MNIIKDLITKYHKQDNSHLAGFIFITAFRNLELSISQDNYCYHFFFLYKENDTFKSFYLHFYYNPDSNNSLIEQFDDIQMFQFLDYNFMVSYKDKISDYILKESINNVSMLNFFILQFNPTILTKFFADINFFSNQNILNLINHLLENTFNKYQFEYFKLGCLLIKNNNFTLQHFYPKRLDYIFDNNILALVCESKNFDDFIQKVDTESLNFLLYPTQGFFLRNDNKIFDLLVFKNIVNNTSLINLLENSSSQLNSSSFLNIIDSFYFVKNSGNSPLSLQHFLLYYFWKENKFHIFINNFDEIYKDLYKTFKFSLEHNYINKEQKIDNIVTSIYDYEYVESFIFYNEMSNF